MDPIAAVRRSLDEPDLGIPEEPEGLHVNELLVMLLDQKGSDLHLTAGSPPVIRVHGELRPVPGVDPINGSDIREMIYAILTQKQRERFETELELDSLYTLPGMSRFRVNVFLQRDSVGAVLRAIPYEIVDFDQLGLPASVSQFADAAAGLVLVTGPTGSGKSRRWPRWSTSSTARRPLHIMTVEDPIEFLHHHKRRSSTSARSARTRLVRRALRHVLRQDPDVILVGEMRDLETISTALTAAETGHLVFATLHTQDAAADDRPHHRRLPAAPAAADPRAARRVAPGRRAPSSCCTTADGRAGRWRPRCWSQRRDPQPDPRGQDPPDLLAMQAGGKFGMQTMDQALAVLVHAGQITRRPRSNAAPTRKTSGG